MRGKLLYVVIDGDMYADYITRVFIRSIIHHSTYTGQVLMLDVCNSTEPNSL